MSEQKGYIKKKSKTIPFGYELSDKEGWLKPIQKELIALSKYIIQFQKYNNQLYLTNLD